MNILAMTGWLILIVANVYYDWKRISNHKGINHVGETIARIFVGILYAGLVFQVRAANEHAQWVILFQVTSFWLFFEFLLNKARNLPAFYLGNTAKTDVWFKKHFPIYAGLKLFALILFVTSVIQLIKGN